MQKYIGKKIEDVIIELQKLGINYHIITNNHNVNGDIVLATNIKMKDNEAFITTGNFIFDLKNYEENKNV